MQYEESHGGGAGGRGWTNYPIDNSKNVIYDSTTDSICLTHEHELSPNLSDSHAYSVLYFVYINQNEDVDDIKFIYSLDIWQVI